ncbi:MAG: MaoC/PaaZ C-terminal domain-containing protein [Rhodocyclaceae bacterium]|nr:MaoC/PaaZ C-terminal domain-containing protein [Rhodocyclaceae bacterium]
MPLNYEVVKNWPFKEITQEYTHRDTILYALGLGAATTNPPAPEDLQFVYERKLVALPTFAVMLAGSGSWVGNPETGITLTKLLHGEQFLTIHKPLPAQGVMVGKDRVEAVYDKGADKGAVLIVARDIREKESGDLVATTGMSLFLRADGGFGGKADGQPKPHPVPEDRAPDASIDLITRPEQAAIYRLSGDYNPLHLDPKIAAMAGFEKPILHGLCSYGIAGRAIIKLLCNNDATRLRKLNVRFASPVYPGETLRTEIWNEGPGKAAFRVKVVERDLVVLNNGLAEYTV